MTNTEKKLTPEEIIQDPNQEFTSFLDGIDPDTFSHQYDSIELPKDVLLKIKNLPAQTLVASIIDNNENIQYVQSERVEKNAPDVGDFILMVENKISIIGSQNEVLEKAKFFLYEKEMKIQDLVILKRIAINIGVFLGN